MHATYCIQHIIFTKHGYILLIKPELVMTFFNLGDLIIPCTVLYKFTKGGFLSQVIFLFLLIQLH